METSKYENLRGDKDSRVIAKFSERSLLGSWKSIPEKKNPTLLESSKPPVLLPLIQSHSKFPERCHALTCACVPNLVGIGWGVLVLFRK